MPDLKNAPTKVVPGKPCSVLSENDIGTVLARLLQRATIAQNR